MENINDLKEICTEEHFKILQKFDETFKYKDIEFLRNKVALDISVDRFIYNREIILKDINYLYGDPKSPKPDFLVVLLDGVYRSFKDIEKVSTLVIYEGGN